MIRLALAIGALAVFGFVAFVISILLIDYFKNKNKKKKWSESKKKNSKPYNPRPNNLTQENND